MSQAEDLRDDIKAITLALALTQETITRGFQDIEQAVGGLEQSLSALEQRIAALEKSVRTRPGWGLWAALLAIAVAGIFLP